MPTTPRGIWTPDLPNNYNLITDWATNATSIDTAIGNVATRIAAERGTAAQRVAMTATTTNGYLWQDTDTLKMLWRRDTTVSGGWAPAVWRWGGTTAQMNSFTQAPNGFEWFNTTDNSDYVRLGGAWVASGGIGTRVVKTSSPLSLANGVFTDLGSGFSVDRTAPGISWTSNRFVVTVAGRYELRGNLLITTSVGYLFTPNSTAAVTFPTTTYSFMSASSAAGEMGLSFSSEINLSAGASVYLTGTPSAGNAGTLRGSTSLMQSWVELKKIS